MLFSKLKINYYKDYLEKRKKVLLYLFFGKKSYIPGLEWEFFKFEKNYKKNN